MLYQVDQRSLSTLVRYLLERKKHYEGSLRTLTYSELEAEDQFSNNTIHI